MTRISACAINFTEVSPIKEGSGGRRRILPGSVLTGTNPESRVTNHGLRITSPESRVTNPESRVPSYESLPALLAGRQAVILAKDLIDQVRNGPVLPLGILLQVFISLLVEVDGLIDAFLAGLTGFLFFAHCFTLYIHW